MDVTQGEAATPVGTRREVIRDPTLNNMEAFEFPVPRSLSEIDFDCNQVFCVSLCLVLTCACMCVI